MPKICIVRDGVVENVIVATLVEAQAAFPDAVCVEAPEQKGGGAAVGIGATFDGKAFEWVLPEHRQEKINARRQQAGRAPLPTFSPFRVEIMKPDLRDGSERRGDS